ncbi:LysR family transcriptional regulator [Spelaeicoccus albus]
MTHVGKDFYAKSRNIIDAIQGIDGLISETRSGRAGSLRVGLVPSLMHGPVPAIIKTFADSRPDLDLDLSYESTTVLREQLADARLDVALLYSAPKVGGFAHTTLCDEPFLTVINSDHRLASTDEISFGDLKDERLITIPREAAPENHDALVVACLQHGFSPNGLTAPGSYLSHVGLVSAGLGISFIPASIARLAISNISYKRLVDPEVRLESHVCWHSKRSSAMIEAFVNHCVAKITTQSIDHTRAIHSEVHEAPI